MTISEFVNYLNSEIFPQMRETSPGSVFTVSSKPRFGAHHDWQCIIPHEQDQGLIHIIKDDKKIFGFSRQFIKDLPRKDANRDTFKYLIEAG